MLPNRKRNIHLYIVLSIFFREDFWKANDTVTHMYVYELRGDKIRAVLWSVCTSISQFNSMPIHSETQIVGTGKCEGQEFSIYSDSMDR